MNYWLVTLWICDCIHCTYMWIGDLPQQRRHLPLVKTNLKLHTYIICIYTHTRNNAWNNNGRNLPRKCKDAFNTTTLTCIHCTPSKATLTARISRPANSQGYILHVFCLAIFVSFLWSDVFCNPDVTPT